MSTKNDPGEWDFYANAEPDEPMFYLLGRDSTAAYFVAAWVAVRCDDMETAVKMMFAARNARKESGKGFKQPTDPKMVEAIQCSRDIMNWERHKWLKGLQHLKAKDMVEGRWYKTETYGPFKAGWKMKDDSVLVYLDGNMNMQSSVTLRPDEEVEVAVPKV